jgi:hypothetical protein
MKTLKWVIAAIVLGASGALPAAVNSAVVVTHFEQMQNLRVEQSVTINSPGALSGAPLTLRFDAMGQTFDLHLTSNNRLLSAAAVAALPAGVQLYRGSISGKKNSWARIVIADGIPRGMLWDGAEMYALEAPDDSAVASDHPVIYRLADTYVNSGAMSCGSGADLSAVNGAAAYLNLVEDLEVAIGEAQGATTQLNLGAIGDAAFVSDMNNSGNNPTTAILTRLNTVDGIFSEQLGVQLAVQQPELFDVDPSQFTGATDSSVLLGELSDYRLSSPTQSATGLTHMYTGANLDGSTVGIAYIDAICSTRFGVGLSQGNLGATTDALVAAHEIGHNFGAPHDGEGACAAETGQFIMAPSISSVDQFSACSITQMQAAMVGKSCFVALAGADMAVTATTPDITALLGNSATANFSVQNIGTDEASNVSVEISSPALADFVSASTTIGNCTDGAGSATCQLGTVAGGDSITVGVSTISSAVGADSFSATVTATEDVLTINNQASVQLTVTPAVDLSVTVPGTLQLQINQATTVSVSLDNSAIVDADNVTLSVVVGAGIRVDSASWDIGSCAISGQQIDCEATTFGSQSSASLTFGVTGMATGSQSYEITLATDTDDRDSTNNSATGTISVNNPPPPPGGGTADSGGGGTGSPALILLLIATLAGRRYRPLVH